MPSYCIIETDDGMMIAERRAAATAEEIAQEHGAALIDPGPYETYEEAGDALIGLQQELDDDDQSELPGSQPLEGRYETGD